MLSSKERYVIFVEVQIRPVPASGPGDTPVSAILSKLRWAMKMKKNIVDLEAGAKEITLEKIKEISSEDGKKYVCLLLNYGDKYGADSVFRNRTTRSVRKAGKTADDDSLFSAHVVLSVDADKSSGKYVFRGLLEDVPGLGRTRLVHALNIMLKTAGPLQYQHNGVDAPYQPKLQIDASQTAHLKKELKDGIVSHFLLSKKEIKGFDESGYANEVEATTKVKLVESDAPLWKRVMSVFNKAKGEYDEIRLIYKRADTGNPKTVELRAHRDGADDFLLGRVEHIGLEKDLDQASTTICDELVNAMIALLSKPKK